MPTPEHYQRLARYNAWMNQSLYGTARQLDDQALHQPRGAFFGSITGTLNHLMVADLIWLGRFARGDCARQLPEALRGFPAPARLDEPLYDHFDALRQAREQLDAHIQHWVDTLTAGDLQQHLAYSNTRGIPARKPLHALLAHVFNHQTHHRGQVTTLLSQAGLDPGITDLLAMIPDEWENDPE